MHYSFKTSGVCSRAVDFDLSADGTVTDVRFTGGCHGNTQGVSALAQGMKADELISRLKDIQCGNKGTSCPAQLAKALSSALEEVGA